jgi:hypothetical protein
MFRPFTFAENGLWRQRRVGGVSGQITGVFGHSARASASEVEAWPRSAKSLLQGPRKDYRAALGLLRRTQLSCRSQLTFTDHVHDLNTCNGYRRQSSS